MTVTGFNRARRELTRRSVTVTLPAPIAPVPQPQPEPPTEEPTKRQIMAELDARGISYLARDTKDQLLARLRG